MSLDNISAISYSITPDDDFDSFSSFYLSWNHRVKIIVSLLRDLDKDIICLQGIKISTFWSDFSDILGKYDCICQTHDDYLSQKYKGNGNAVFWKKEVISYISCEATIYGIFLELSIDDVPFLIGSVKLVEGLRKLKERLFQIKSCLKKINSFADVATVIIVGDFSSNIRYDSDIINLISSNSLSIETNGKSSVTIGPYGKIIAEHDFILHNSAVIIEKIMNKNNLSDIPDDKNPSNHYPLIFNFSVSI